MTEPVAVNAWVLDLWREHQDTQPLLVLRCGNSRPRPCSRVVGRVWATPAGLLLWSKLNVPGMSTPIEGEPADATWLMENNVAPFDKYNASTGAALISRDSGDPGLLSILNRDDYWFGAEVGCVKHGIAELDRERIRSAARNAPRRDDRPTVIKIDVC